MSETDTKQRVLQLASLHLEMKWCPPGYFIMGCSEDEEGDAEDAPLHPVTITQGFWIGKFQITQAMYDIVASMARVPMSPSKYQGPNKPVERVTWINAVQWCNALTQLEKSAGRLPEGYVYRLPTEAEWEYACRAGSTTALNNGKILTSKDGSCPNLDEVAWYDKNSGMETHDVGMKQPNNWGIYDMHGNVEEWCCDWYGEYPQGAVTDPVGPSAGRYHVCRGGNMGGMAIFCSSSARKGGNPNNRRGYRGFRLVLGPILNIDFDLVTQQPAAIAQQAMSTEAQLSPEELLRIRQELETAQQVDKPFEQAVFGNTAVPGARNFTLPEPALRMLWCPAGTFTMGSPETESGRNTDEQQHSVTFSRGFWMSMYEITQEDYAVIAECTNLRSRPANFAGLRRPVEQVDYETACRWCRELTYLELIAGRLPDGYEYRLPTEAEWEYACRAGTTTIFNNPETETKPEESRQIFERMSWYKYNSGYKTHSVGERAANAWGFCDMHGNIREWCLDWYGDYPVAPTTDYTGPQTGTLRITRGGCYGDYPRHCRSAHRGSADPTSTKANIGFRVVLAPIVR